MDDTLKITILGLLDKWTRQRAGLEWANYGDAKSYRAEQRAITRDLHDYRELAKRVEWSSITGEQLREAFRAYSGRLRLTEKDGKLSLDYCTGQYFPTEYRKAACAVLASALWDYIRESMPDADGYKLRSHFRREFGRGIASRYFN